MDCNLLVKIIIVIFACYIAIYMNNNFRIDHYTNGSANLIGVIYPPKLGPVQTSMDENQPYVAIYDKEPFLMYHQR